MRAALLVVVVFAGAAGAAADPLPPGAIGAVTGAVSGTGADAKRVGFGYQVGAQASWQPTTTERKWGWTLRGTLLFSSLYGGSAVQIEPSLKTVQMDMTAGLRFRPWATPSRYLTLRAGGALLRTNEPVPPQMSRAFLGGTASAGLDQYVGRALFSIDVRYGLIGNGPDELALLVGIGVAGP